MRGQVAPRVASDVNPLEDVLPYFLREEEISVLYHELPVFDLGEHLAGVTLFNSVRDSKLKNICTISIRAGFELKLEIVDSKLVELGLDPVHCNPRSARMLLSNRENRLFGLRRLNGLQSQGRRGQDGDENEGNGYDPNKVGLHVGIPPENIFVH